MEYISKQFQHDGAKVTWYKKGEGKPLVILHGWGSSGDVMKPLADKLSDIRTCIVVDLPGFGRSPEPLEGWDIGRYADMVSALMNSEFADQPVDFLVHSFGGRIILKILSADKRPLNVDKVIITGGAGLKPKRSIQFHIKRLTATMLKLPVKLVIPSKRETVMSRLRNTALWKSLGSSDYSKLSGVMRETFVKSVTEFFDDKLAEIPDEILLLWGSDDSATPIDQAKRLESGLKNSALVQIDNAGHYAFLDQPTKFVSISRAYLEGG